MFLLLWLEREKNNLLLLPKTDYRDKGRGHDRRPVINTMHTCLYVTNHYVITLYPLCCLPWPLTVEIRYERHCGRSTLLRGENDSKLQVIQASRYIIMFSQRHQLYVEDVLLNEESEIQEERQFVFQGQCMVPDGSRGLSGW